MLATAVKARLPLVYAVTDDALNFPAVLKCLTGADVGIETMSNIGSMGAMPPYRTMKKDSIGWWNSPPEDTNWVEAYKALLAKNSVLIVTNVTYSPPMFNVGFIPLPDTILSDFVTKYGPDENAYELIAALRGLSYKDVVETTKLAMTKYGEFTARAVLAIRRERTVLSDGLRLVNTEYEFHWPDKKLVEWLTLDGLVFRMNADRAIRPRGLLFNGPPGCGKTSSAKYISRQLGLPLYYLNIAGVMQKYHGESERLFQTAITQAENLTPCVLLIDEVEKMFGSHDDDTGVTKRVLSMLLWWLQEHNAQVLTVMTTNDQAAIPPELIRPGRIDQMIQFKGLSDEQIPFFLKGVMHSFKDMKPKINFDDHDFDLILQTLRTTVGFPPTPQARVVQVVRDLAKQKLIASTKE
jgi:hypothetical protein